METPKLICKYTELIQEDMKKIILGNDDLISMMKYHLGWVDKNFKGTNGYPGKLSRPSLCLGVCEALEGSVKKALPAATAIQIFHDFSLLHDDIEDNDKYRRHKETVWKIWGVPKAINVGDSLYTLSFVSLLRIKDKLDEVLEILINTYRKIIKGQDLDLSFAENEIDLITEDKYFEMIRNKSAELISASAKIGAFLAGSEEKVIKYFYDFGIQLGLAYQMYDDTVSIWGKKEKTGKEECKDIIEKKKTLPIIHVLEKAENKDKDFIKSIYDKEILENKDVILVKNILDKLNVKKFMISEFKKYKGNALRSLEKVNLPKDKEKDFIDFVNYLIPEIQ